MNKRETATVLAALRLFQDVRDMDPDLIEPYRNFHFTEDAPLADDEINELCERINTSTVAFEPQVARKIEEA
ncbi:MAG: hypothetical protein ABEL51_15685 [Salinibacter sp.]